MHPELLDWLAVWFMDEGWSLKKLHRLIVTTRAYPGRDSRIRPELLERTMRPTCCWPRGRARIEGGARSRVPLCKVANLLSTRLDGPSVFPPQLPSVTTEGTYGPMQWPGPARARIAFAGASTPSPKRTAPFAALFHVPDAPSGEACMATARDVYNAAMHALFLLNDITFVEAAQAIGRVLASQTGTVEQRIDALFERLP